MEPNGEDDIVRQYQLDTPISLPETLDAADIEALEVDDTRMVVIYHQAATDGTPTAATAIMGTTTERLNRSGRTTLLPYRRTPDNDPDNDRYVTSRVTTGE